MKKITLIITFLLFSILSEAQIVASQNFDASLGWTASSTAAWSRRTTGGAPACNTFAGAGMARFYSYNLSAGTTARLTSPAITLTGGTYRVKFKMFRDNAYAGDADNLQFYINTSGVAGGTLLGTVNRSRSLAPTETEDGWYSYSMDIPGAITGTRYINILGTSAYGNNIFIDEITIEQIPAIDGELRLMSVNSYVPSGTTTIAGTFKNSGSTAVTTFQAKWQVDAGTIYTQTFSGLNIAPGQTYDFIHSNIWSQTPGLYSLKLWVSNVNGSTDADATNDQITRNISVFSNTTTRFPLYEKFSSSTCGPCYSFNTNSFNSFLANNETNFGLISYQVNWPGSGDPYYTAEIGSRVGYYGISGAPTLLVDSKDGTNNEVTGAFNSTAQLGTKLTEAIAKPAYFNVNASRTLVGSNNMSVQVDVTPFVTGTYKMYVAVVEKNTYNNAASNGETEFHNVMMKMMPDANGTSINFVHDVPTSNNLQAVLTGLFIEQLSDLEVVVFIQDPVTKAIMQATYATNALATNDFSSISKIKLYPNPSTGIITIATDITVDVVITDITGKMVYQMNEVTASTQLNLSSLQKGMYLVKISGDGSEKTEKLILK